MQLNACSAMHYLWDSGGSTLPSTLLFSDLTSILIPLAVQAMFPAVIVWHAIIVPLPSLSIPFPYPPIHVRIAI